MDEGAQRWELDPLWQQVEEQQVLDIQNLKQQLEGFGISTPPWTEDAYLETVDVSEIQSHERIIHLLDDRLYEARSTVEALQEHPATHKATDYESTLPEEFAEQYRVYKHILKDRKLVVERHQV